MAANSMNLSKLIAENNLRLKKTGSDVVPSGFSNFDRKFGGFSIGEFVVLGGRPSMGKTQLLLSICRNISMSTPILYFTFDHSESVIASRFLSSLSNIPINQILQNELKDEDITRLAYYQKHSNEHKLFISDHGNSINDFKEQCLNEIEENRIKVIIIDDLQKMKADKGENKTQLATITNELKNFAKLKDVVIIAASQLNRTVDKRGGDGRPLLSDLKGSDTIEEDADKVIFVHRPEYYGITVEINGTSTNGLMELIMAKNKNGKLGTIRLLRDINFTVFDK